MSSLIRAARRSSFVSDESGSITVLSLFLMIAMIFTAGLGVDMARSELIRARFQSTIDRATLAATDLESCRLGESHAQDVFTTYLETGGFSGFVTNVSIDMGVNECSVVADASLELNTIFMPIFGVEDLDVVVSSAATESVENVEISLVLDVSYSMRSSGKIEALRPAARDFVTTVLDQASAPDTISMNLVQFGGHVNPGRNMFDFLRGQRLVSPQLADGSDWPDVSSCLQIDENDYQNIELPAPFAQQVPIFGMYNMVNDGQHQFGWCPNDESSIVYASNDEAELHTAIDDIMLYAGTGSDIGIKWGISLLNPSSRPAMQYLGAQGEVDAAFTDRPLQFAPSTNQKYLVVMTDGEVVQQLLPLDFFDERNLSVNLNRQPGGRVGNINYINTNEEATDLFLEQCELAKNQGIVVFTIGFQTSSDAEDELAECATSPSHFYDVDDANIASAFQGISATISSLRLTN